MRPITETFGFIKCDAQKAVRFFVDWEHRVQKSRGVSVVERTVGGGLETVLRTLLPLNSVESRRFLFMPTRSEWIAFLDNGHLGTDDSAISYMAEKLRTTSIRATCAPTETPKGWPCVYLIMYGAKSKNFINEVRTIGASYDGYKWSFDLIGEVQPFEETERYLARRIRDRFTPDMLDRYLQALGISMFDEDFYLPDGTATLVEKIGPIAPNAEEFSLKELQ